MTDTPEPCTEEAREQDCCCTLEFVGPYPTDIPEPKRHPECPLHGWRDPDAELDRKRDDEMMDRMERKNR